MNVSGVRADLHMHTHYSDGIYSPYDLIHKAKSRGLSIISITDHDSVSGISDAIEFGKECDVQVIPGVELSAAVDGKEIHILGYFVDHLNERLLEYLSFFRIERMKRAERIVAKLNTLNVPLTMASVIERAGTGSVGRPHIASALVDEGFIETYREAFERLIGTGCPAYERKFQLSPSEAIKLLGAAGGLSFLAHPGRFVDEGTVQHLVKSGLDGIEVVHPSHSPEWVAHYRGVVGEYCLLESGGSDFHGGKRNDDEALGSFYIDESKVEAMKRRLFSQKSR
jgi:3',5'-nucleoside bisphosphate phosphatase